MNYSTEKIQNVFRKIIAEQSVITLSQFRDEYLSAIKCTHSESYVTSVTYTFNQLLGFSEDIPLSKLNNRILENFITSKYKTSKSSAALNYRNLKAAFTKAVTWDYITSNPFYKIQLPKVQQPVPAYLTIDELEKIIEKVEAADLRELYLFAFFTGLRLAEIRNLKWSNVNLRDRLLQIGDSDFQTKGKKIRFVPISERVYEILQGRIPKLIRHNGHFVFGKKSNFKYSGDYISKQFKKGVRAARMSEDIHFHSLRHSFASNLVKGGVPIYNVSKLLGHSSVAVTERYAHLDISSLTEAIKVFDNVIQVENKQRNAGRCYKSL